MGNWRKKKSNRYLKRYSQKRYRYSQTPTSRLAKRSIILRIGAVALAVFVVGLIVTTLRESSVTAENSSVDIPENIPQRIISLAPSVTETLFALGVDSLLVGVTQYCTYPAAADTLPEVGGFLDPNLEVMIALQPDLVIMLRESAELAEKLRKLGLHTLLVNHQTVTGVLESYSTIGAFVGVKARGDSMRAAQKTRLQTISAYTKNAPRPTALISIGHSDQPGMIKSVYVTGADDFYSALLKIAGGENVITDTRVRYPVYDTEGMLTLNPEYIFDIFPGGADAQRIDRAFVLKQWASLPNLEAVKQNRVIVLEGAFFVIPGPRMLMIAEAFLAALHPQIATEISELATQSEQPGQLEQSER